MANEPSIELSYEDLREVILKFNFELIVRTHDVEWHGHTMAGAVHHNPCTAQSAAIF